MEVINEIIDSFITSSLSSEPTTENHNTVEDMDTRIK